MKEESEWDQTKVLPFGIRVLPTKDRCVVAKRDIEAGEILYREKSFAWVRDKDE